jgi:hypothetical protein
MKILFAVVGCEAHIQNGLHQLIRETWATDVPASCDFRFFVGHGETVLHPDSVRLDVPDDLEHVLYKSVEILRWSLDHGYHHTLKVTTDTYVNIPEISKVDINYDYIGAPVGRIGGLYGPTNVCGFYQGASTWLSDRAADIVVREAIPRMEELLPEAKKYDGLICPYPHSEDLWIGQVLGSVRWMDDPRYTNGPLTYHFARAKSPIEDWFHGLHQASPNIPEMQRIHESR